MLVHGLWMTGLELFLIRRRLRRAGYRVLTFRYASVRRSPADNAARLCRRLDALPEQRVHFVAHSLGGIVLTHLFARCPRAGERARDGRVVMLGTPLRGSILARVCARRRWLRWALGRSLDHGLLGDHPDWAGPTALAMIAGNRGFGMGLLFPGRLTPPHDGMVSVTETRDPAVRDHLVIRQTHTGLLFSPTAIRAVIDYLASGRLPRPAAASRSTR